MDEFLIGHAFSGRKFNNLSQLSYPVRVPVVVSELSLYAKGFIAILYRFNDDEKAEMIIKAASIQFGPSIEIVSRQ